jgi:hypothetical protein
MSKTNIRPQDINSLAAKLEKFAAGLPEHEQSVVEWMVARARASQEVELADSDLDGAAGGLAEADASDSVKWTHTF